MRDIFSVREYREAYISADSFNEVVEKAVAIRKSEEFIYKIEFILY